MNVKHIGVKQAVVSLVQTNPFFASVILQQEFVEDMKCKTFWVDGKKLGYNPNFADTLSFEELKGVLAHEVMHLVLMHHARMHNRNVEVWNKSTDYLINYQLVKSGFKLPKGALLDNRFTNTNAEDVYRTLMAEEQQKQKDKNKQAKPEKGDKFKDENGTPQPSNEKGDEDGNANGEDSNDSPDNGFGEVRECKDSTPEEMEERAMIMGKLAENAAKACGKSEAGLDRILADVRKRNTDWKEVINRFFNEVTAKDYNFARPNKRFIGSGIVMPSLYSKTIGKVAILVDCSGSVNPDELNKLISEVTTILDNINESKDSAELDIIYFDHKVTGHEVYSGSETLKPKGGGGTDPRVAFKYITDNEFAPELVIVLTDGEFSAFPDEPEYPTLWAITISYGNFKPPFGEVMHLTN